MWVSQGNIFSRSISPSFFFQYNFIEHTHVQLTFTKNNLQQNDNYNLQLTKKYFFLGFFTQLHKLRSLRRSFLHFHFISAFHIWFISYIINTHFFHGKILTHNWPAFNGPERSSLVSIQTKLTFSSQWLSQDISLFLHELSVSWNFCS